jgi:hypothetical protein
VIGARWAVPVSSLADDRGVLVVEHVAFDVKAELALEFPRCVALGIPAAIPVIGLRS